MMLQATAEVPDVDAFKDALAWLIEQVGHPEGFISLQIFAAFDNPNRVTFIEHWRDVESFQKAYAGYDMEQRAEFLSRAGIDAETFGRDLWVETDIPIVTAP